MAKVHDEFMFLLETCYFSQTVKKLSRQKDGKCPIDQYHLSITKDLFPDNFTRREIAEQSRHCPIEGCAQLLPLLDIEKHVSDTHQEYCCVNESLLCTFSKVGCNVKLKSMQQLNTHLDSQLHHHLALLSSAVSEIGLNHKDSVSVKAQEAELWDPQGKNEERDQPADSWKTLMQSLYERIILLEQSNREQENQITSLRSRVTRLVEENENLKYNIPLQFCNGVIVWSVDSFEEKYASMLQDPNRCFYSPPFTTSYVGYKFCARLKLSVLDQNYLSLLVHLKKGEFDKALDWPFSGRIGLSLIHPKNSSLSIRETMMSRPELEAFKQPTRDISPRGFGYSEFVLVSDVLNRGFIENGCILIKVQVQTV